MISIWSALCSGSSQLITWIANEGTAMRGDDLKTESNVTALNIPSLYRKPAPVSKASSTSSVIGAVENFWSGILKRVRPERLAGTSASISSGMTKTRKSS